MTDNHPITPPPALVTSLRNSAPHGIRDAGVTRETWMIHNAYALGADQELEACINYFHEYDTSWGEDSDLIAGLRAARRPKPPSLKEQALAALGSIERGQDRPEDTETIRRALEQLND